MTLKDPLLPISSTEVKYCCAFCASGINALTRSLAVDYGKFGIKANSLSLGYISDAELHELAIGLNTADLVSQP